MLSLAYFPPAFDTQLSRLFREALGFVPVCPCTANKGPHHPVILRAFKDWAARGREKICSFLYLLP